VNKSKWYAQFACVLLMAFGAASIVVQAASSTDPKYRLTDIGSLGGSYTGVGALNKYGQVTGDSNTAGDFEDHAFFWRDDGTPMVDLGNLGYKGQPSWGTAINSSGQVTGSVNTNGSGNDLAFVWKNDGTPAMSLGTLYGSDTDATAINELGQVVGASDSYAFIWLNSGQPMKDLGAFFTGGGDYSLASDINASGEVTGVAAVASGGPYHAFLWRNDGTPMVDLGTLGGNSYGQCINSSGQVAGYSVTKLGGSAAHAVFWRNDGTPIKDLRTLGGADSFPAAMNDLGQIVGYSTLHAHDDTTDHAFIWKNDGTYMANLGTLGGPTSHAVGINNSGWVVGSADTATSGHAFLWKNDGKGMRDLNGLIDPADPLKPYVVLYAAQAINDAGDILAVGVDSRTAGQKAYLVRGSSLALEPLTLAFANQKTGTASAAKPVTVRNNSTSAVPITSITLGGTGAGQFSQSNNCGKSVAAKGSCLINVTFKPTSKGAKTASLSINGGGGGLRVVNLSGTGT
jgi:probable HAF family extracellular repeat protein